MQLTRIELTDYRNITAADLSFEGNRHFFLGPNGQGKTNILEAIALAQGLRSFRTTKRQALIRLGQPQGVVRSHWSHEHRGDTSLGLAMQPSRRQIVLDGDKIRSANAILGIFPIVALNLADRKLLYGGPAARREEIDLLVCQVDPEYTEILSSYEQAVSSRNKLLTQDKPDIASIEAFEAVMLTTARRIIRSRERAVELMLPLFKETFAQFAPTGEIPDLRYEPNTLPDELAAAWLERRLGKDKMLGYTTKGPHRDGYAITFNSEDAELYASEGQKFSIVLALKLAGLRFLQDRLGISPVLVADDLLLELDPQRQKRFWNSLGSLQVFASSTTAPTDSTNWQIWDVKKGCFSKA